MYEKHGWSAIKILLLMKFSGADCFGGHPLFYVKYDNRLKDFCYFERLVLFYSPLMRCICILVGNDNTLF